MSSKITTEKYDIAKMERLKHYLENNAERGNRKFYEIFVDNLKAVDKTNDPGCFDDYTMYMNEDSKVIKVLIYTTSETSPRNDKFIFTISNTEEEKRVQERKQAELSGIEIQNKIDTAITAERERISTEQLKQELEDKTKKLTEAGEYIDQLTEALEAERAYKYNPREIKFGNIASLAIEEVIKRNPTWLKKVPVLGGLTTMISSGQSDENTLEGAADQSTGEDTHASFSKKQASVPAADEVTQAKLNLFANMEASFTEEQMNLVLEIVEKLTCQPGSIATIHKWLLPPAQKKNEEKGNTGGKEAA